MSTENGSAEVIVPILMGDVLTRDARLVVLARPTAGESSTGDARLRVLGGAHAKDESAAAG